MSGFEWVCVEASLGCVLGGGVVCGCGCGDMRGPWSECVCPSVCACMCTQRWGQ